ncbi:MAG: hypothetical protein GY795_22470 [Desulfobacterales bacterium]|nr:hypothetical protein [Desulfobacterales bacterium]
MGLFNIVMNLIYEEDTTPEPPRTVTSQAATASSPPPPQTQTQTQTTPQPVQSPQATAPQAPSQPAPEKTQPKKIKIDNEVYKEFTRSLQDAVSAHNLPGFDLYEFHQIFKQGIAGGKTAQESFNLALSASETMRVSKTSLAENYDHYIEVLDEQKNIFQGDLKTFYDENIKIPKAEQEKIDQEIDEKTVLMRQLESEIEILLEKRKNIAVNTEPAENQMKAVKAAFDKAYDEISSQLKNITDILKNI